MRLFPLDRTQFPAPTGADLPLFNLPPRVLLNDDYLHAQLYHATLHGFASENAARMVAMEAARHQIERQLAGLTATQRHVRQEEITAKIIELTAGEIAGKPVRIRTVFA